jgi:ankyrin repeat protein
MMRLAVMQIEWTALMYAAANGRTECVRALLKAKTDKETKDKVRSICLFSRI